MYTFWNELFVIDSLVNKTRFCSCMAINDHLHLQRVGTHLLQGAWEESKWTDLGHMMNSIQVHAAQNTRNSVDNTMLSPPVFIKGTHRNSLHSEPQAKLVSCLAVFRKVGALWLHLLPGHWEGWCQLDFARNGVITFLANHKVAQWADVCIVTALYKRHGEWGTGTL